MSLLRVRYQTFEFGDLDIHLRTLRDKQQFLDVDGVAERLGISSALWPLFGVVWPAGEVLAHLMLDYDVAGKRILEVGCGVALASMVLNYRLANITATDYHPEVENFLLVNTLLNKGRTIPFVRTGWDDTSNDLDEFDLIIGSDLLYERDHIDLLSCFIEQHASLHCEVIIVDPGRAQYMAFSKKMIAMGYVYSHNKPVDADYLLQPFKGQILHYCR